MVSPPQINKSGDAALFNVIATTAPAAPATADLVRTIRVLRDPAVARHGDDLDAYVGGQTASYVDLADGIAAKLPLVIAAVIALGFLVLMMALPLVPVPRPGGARNLLSVCAAFGVVDGLLPVRLGTRPRRPRHRQRRPTRSRASCR